MRSLVNKKDKSKQNQLILGVFLIIVMLFSILGYALGGRDGENNEKIEYDEIEFIRDNSGYWNFNVQGYDFMTKYNPQEVENISFFNSLTFNNYNNKPLYFVSEFNEPNYEISRNLNQFVLRIQGGCLSEKNCEKSFPIKNCSIDNIIIINEPLLEGVEEIYQRDNCVFIVASFENQTRYSDAFLFKILGI
jgi:hypothetical protein